MIAPAKPLSPSTLTGLPRTSLITLLSWAVLLALLAGSWRGADMRPLDLVRDAGNMATYAADFFPPKFAQWPLYLTEMVVTIQIALGYGAGGDLCGPARADVLGQYHASLGAPTGAPLDGCGARDQ